MNGRLLVLPSRREIFCRSVCYGAAWGAAIGAVASVLPAAFAAAYVVGLLFFGAIAGAVGAIVGAVCGFIAGLCLVIFRRQAGASRWAARFIAGAGAGLLPATWTVAAMVGSGHTWLPVLDALAFVVVALAAALGPYAFYGNPRRRRRARRPNPVRREP